MKRKYLHEEEEDRNTQMIGNQLTNNIHSTEKVYKQEHAALDYVK